MEQCGSELSEKHDAVCCPDLHWPLLSFSNAFFANFHHSLNSTLFSWQYVCFLMYHHAHVELSTPFVVIEAHAR